MSLLNPTRNAEKTRKRSQIEMKAASLPRQTAIKHYQMPRESEESGPLMLLNLSPAHCTKASVFQ
jgi:hypothetical protein